MVRLIRSCGTKRCFGGDGSGRRGLVLFGLFAWVTPGLWVP